MFAYCANNPLISIDPTGHSFMDALWDELEVECWRVISDFLHEVGYKLTSKLLEMATRGKGQSYRASSGSEISNLCKSDPSIQKSVEENLKKIKPDENGVINHAWGATIPISYGDLGLAVHNCTIHVNGVVVGNSFFANVIITDEFDFTEFVNPFEQNSLLEGLAWLANDIAYIDSQGGYLNPVGVTIIFYKEYEYESPIS